MGRTRLVGAVLAGAALAGAAWAQPQQQQQQQQAQPEPGPAKIAFVYVQRALASTDEGKARLKELDDWAKPRREALARLDKEVNDMKGDLVTKQGVASDEALADLNRKLVDKQRELEDKQRDAQRDFDARRQTVLKDLGGKLQDVINKYADANHFTAVFIFNPDQLAYLANSADITATVIKLYNAQYPLAAKAAATPAK